MIIMKSSTLVSDFDLYLKINDDITFAGHELLFDMSSICQLFIMPLAYRFPYINEQVLKIVLLKKIMCIRRTSI